MGCFEDYMQFRDEVDEAKKKILRRGACNVRLHMQDLEKREEDISKPKVKA
ncbi:MAG: hypothetical protein M0Q13_06560 [Methanothrix sp.]|jgi:hypothetical protein|nr:hypothetical protein [Methanothrix sp.]